jgi:hypothetical protein
MASNPDLVIRGGGVADGLGGELFEADVAVTDGRITEVGRGAGKGKEEIDARTGFTRIRRRCITTFPSAAAVCRSRSMAMTPPSSRAW